MTYEKNMHIDSSKKIKVIFNSYYRTMVSFANSFLSDFDECEDVVQGVFLELWKSHLIFPNDNALRAYLYRTIKNKCLNCLKHKKVKEKYIEIKNYSSPKHMDIDSDILREESARILYEAIQKLHPRKKQIIEFSLQGLTNVLIAERLGIEVQTVKNLKSKAYESLKNYFNEINKD